MKDPRKSVPRAGDVRCGHGAAATRKMRTVQKDVRRTSTTYDALDRQVKVTNYDDHAPGAPDTVVDEVEYEYDKCRAEAKKSSLSFVTAW